MKHFIKSGLCKFYIVNNKDAMNSFINDFDDVDISFINDEVTSEFLNNKIVILYNQTFNFCLDVSKNVEKLILVNFLLLIFQV